MNSAKIKKDFTKIKIVKGYIAQRTGNSVVIFDTKKSLLHTFNDTATYIFDRLKRGISIKKITKDLSSDFGISQKKAELDVAEFIEMVIVKGLAKKI